MASFSVAMGFKAKPGLRTWENGWVTRFHLLHSLKPNSKFAPENGWLVQMFQILWGGRQGPIFRGELAVSFREGIAPKNQRLDPPFCKAGFFLDLQSPPVT